VIGKILIELCVLKLIFYDIPLLSFLSLPLGVLCSGLLIGVGGGVGIVGVGFFAWLFIGVVVLLLLLLGDPGGSFVS